MVRVTLVALLAVLMGSLASYAVSGQASQAPTQKLDIVESIGCLAEAPKGTWVLTDATEPAVAKQPYTNDAARKEAAARPLGTQRFMLIAISMFNPDALRSHKVAAKGLLIKDPAGNRINVTSLQPVADSCK